MHNRTRIIELQVVIKSALNQWVPKPATYIGASLVIEPPFCSKCGGEGVTVESGMIFDATYSIERKAPASYFPPEVPFMQRFAQGAACQPMRYCKGCFPELTAQLIELETLLQRHRGRSERAGHIRGYRWDVRSRAIAFGPRFQQAWFRTYIPRNQSQQQAKNQLQRWLSDPTAQSRCPMFVLAGNPGLGKSHLLIAAWRKLARAGTIATFKNEGQFASAWHQSHKAYDGYGGMTPAEVIEEARTARILIWDDLGKARLTDAWAAAIYSIFDYRYANCLPTIVSSNFIGKELSDRISVWTADRITSGANFLLTGDSYRVAG